MLTAYRRVFGNSRLARLLAGEFISSIGDWLYLVAVLVVVYEQSHDALALGLVGAARIAPYLILSVPAGIVADRFDRRTVLLVTDVVRGLLMVVLAALILVEAPVLSIVAVVIVASCVATFFGPAIGAYLPSLVDDEADLGPANSVWATLDNLAFFVGPAIAGVLIAVGGLATAFILNAASFAFVAIMLATLPSRRTLIEAAEDKARAEDVEVARANPAATWRTIIGRIPGIIVLDLATSFAGGGLGVLTVVIAVDSLNAGEAATGLLNAATGIGGIAAGVAAGWVVLRRLDLGIVVGSLIGAAGLVVLGTTHDLVPALIAIGIAVGALLLLDVITATIVQRLVPDEERGRAMGALQIPSALASIAGAFMAPLLADRFGVATALVVIAIGSTAFGLAAVLVLRPTGVLVSSGLDPRRLELLRSSVFGGVLPIRIEAAARRLEPVEVEAGQRVIEQGDAADRVYLIDSGAFDVSQRAPDGATVALRTMGPGEVFGEIGILSSIPRTATVTAASAGRLFALDRDGFLGLVDAGPGLTTQLLDRYRGTWDRT
ncbi:MAG TPA: MFS transporter [Candidatus Limnocylindrales bacterium]